MNNERSKVTMNLPVSFNINYKEDGTISIDIDTKTLEITIVKAIIKALEDYNMIKSKTDEDCSDNVDSSATTAQAAVDDAMNSKVMIVGKDIQESSWFIDTCVGVDDGRITFIKFPNGLSINFGYDESYNLSKVINQGQLKDIKTIGNYILTYSIL